MWLQYLSGRSDEVLEKVTVVKAFYKGEYSYIFINSHYVIECTTETGCKEFFREIISRLNDPTAVIKNDVVTDIGGLVND